MEDLIIGEEYIFTGCSEAQSKWGSYTGNPNNLIVGKKYVITNIEIHIFMIALLIV